MTENSGKSNGPDWARRVENPKPPEIDAVFHARLNLWIIAAVIGFPLSFIAGYYDQPLIAGAIIAPLLLWRLLIIFQP